MSDNAKKILKIIGIIIIITIVIGGGYFAYEKFIKKTLPGIKQTQNIVTPEPLVKQETNGMASDMSPSKIVEDTNKERVDNKLNKLSTNEQLTKAAQDKVEDMFTHQYFEHVSPFDSRDVSYWVQNAGYAYKVVGENLAMGDFSSEADLVQAWMNSPGHRANILNSEFTQIGVAVKKDVINGRKTWLAVQIFSSPAPDCTLPNAELKATIENKEKEYSQIKNLESSINTLRADGDKLLADGNTKITEGNKYEQSGDHVKAQELWTEGERLQNLGKAKYDEANNLVEQANNLSQIYDEVKKLTEDYNAQIESYNNCIK